MRSFGFLVAFCLSVGAFAADCDKKTTTARLKEDLLCGYDLTVRPKIDRDNATHVTIRMILKYFTYNMHESSIAVNTWIVLHWKDDHLVWKPEQYDDIKSIHISSEYIWIPDISVYNRVDQSGSPTAFTHVDCLLFNTGTVICIPPTRHEAICKPNLTKFPFDVQNCTLRYGSWIHSGEEIDFKLANPAVTQDDFVENGEWKLLNVSVTKLGGHFNCCPENTYPSINYNFVIERHSGAQVCFMIIPALVLVIMTLSTLSLPADETARVIIIASNLLCHLLYLQAIFWQLPVTGPESPLIVIYGRDSFLLVGFTLVLTVIQRKLMRVTSASPIWISSAVATVLNIRIIQTVFFIDNNFQNLGKRLGDDDGTSIIENSDKQKNKDWIIFANILNKLCLIIYIIVYFCMFVAFVP